MKTGEPQEELVQTVECGVDCGCSDRDPCPFEDVPHYGMDGLDE